MGLLRRILVLLWNFICFLPLFIGLLILGLLKGLIIVPIVFVILTVGNSAIVLELWPAHAVWAYFCLFSTKQLWVVTKLLLFILVTPPLAVWPVFAVLVSIAGSILYGLLGPLFGTLKAVSEGRTNKFLHCVTDGTWDTIKGSLIFVRDLKDVCLYSYFSALDDLRKKEHPLEGKIEVRVLYVLIALFVGPIMTVIAALKSPYMLLRGWQRLFQDCIGREGPFLESICVPFAGLAILLWPFAVAGAMLASMLAGIFLGFYAGFVAYQ